MKTTVGDITSFLEAHPECAGKILVNTRFGYKKILAAGITAKKSNVIKITKPLIMKNKCTPK